MYELVWPGFPPHPRPAFSCGRSSCSGNCREDVVPEGPRSPPLKRRNRCRTVLPRTRWKTRSGNPRGDPQREAQWSQGPRVLGQWAPP